EVFGPAEVQPKTLKGPRFDLLAATDAIHHQLVKSVGRAGTQPFYNPSVQTKYPHADVKVVGWLFNKLYSAMVGIILNDPEIDFRGALVDGHGNVIIPAYVVAIKIRKIQVAKNIPVHYQKIFWDIRNQCERANRVEGRF